MPRGDKSKYTAKQQRMAEHIEEGYEQRGTPEEEAERRAWATVNKVTGGGKQGGSGEGKKENKEPMKRVAESAARRVAKRSPRARLRPARPRPQGRQDARRTPHAQALLRPLRVANTAAVG